MTKEGMTRKMNTHLGSHFNHGRHTVRTEAEGSEPRQQSENEQAESSVQRKTKYSR